jgi:uncharacterized protein (DUF2237 family)
MVDRNVLGGELEPCSSDPVTGFYRDGCCNTGAEDNVSHTICAVVTSEFLKHQSSIGNDLSTPMPQYGFPGLVPLSLLRRSRLCETDFFFFLTAIVSFLSGINIATTHSI